MGLTHVLLCLLFFLNLEILLTLKIKVLRLTKRTRMQKTTKNAFAGMTLNQLPVCKKLNHFVIVIR